MCGLIGLLSFSSPLSPSLLQRGMRALSHRGPDGEGAFVSPEKTVLLGHQRLAVIGLQRGQQPLYSEDKQIVAVVNGEFYGFEEIRSQLQAKGHIFSTETDSEILIHLYEEHGTEALSFLRGEFSFLLWDQRERLLFAARDRFGVRPLCYSATKDGLWFASEAKALLAMGHPASWNQAALFQAMGLQYLLPEQTIFAGVSQLPPGCFLLAKGERVSIRPYWKMHFSEAPLSNEREAVEEIEAALTEAIQVRLRADVPISFQLSGGLDSSVVVALASQKNIPLHCFTVRFDQEGYDEWTHANEVADFCGATLHTVEVGPSQIVTNLERAISHGEGFCINAHIAAKYALSRAIKEAGFTVVLTGEGADEVFGGYAHLQQDYAESVKDSVGRVTERHSHTLGVHLPMGEGLSVAPIERALGFVPTFLRAKATLGAKLSTLLHPDFSSQLQDHNPAAQMVASLPKEELQNYHPVQQAMILWARLGFAGYILKTLGDGMEMAHALEGRLPFTDHRLFAVLSRLPLSLLFRPLQEKYPLRQAALGRLPESIRQRTKQPFMAPPLRAEPTFEKYLQERLQGKLPSFLAREAVVALLERLSSMSLVEKQAWDPALFLVLSAVILEERYFSSR